MLWDARSDLRKTPVNLSTSYLHDLINYFKLIQKTIKDRDKLLYFDQLSIYNPRPAMHLHVWTLTSLKNLGKIRPHFFAVLTSSTRFVCRIQVNHLKNI